MRLSGRSSMAGTRMRGQHRRREGDHGAVESPVAQAVGRRGHQACATRSVRWRRDALVASILSGHVSDEFPEEGGHAQERSVRRESRITLRRVIHPSPPSDIGGRAPWRRGFTGTGSCRSHADSMHDGLAALTVTAVVCAPGIMRRTEGRPEPVVPAISDERKAPVTVGACPVVSPRRFSAGRQTSWSLPGSGRPRPSSRPRWPKQSTRARKA